MIWMYSASAGNETSPSAATAYVGTVDLCTDVRPLTLTIEASRVRGEFVGSHGTSYEFHGSIDETSGKLTGYVQVVSVSGSRQKANPIIDGKLEKGVLSGHFKSTSCNPEFRLLGNGQASNERSANPGANDGDELPAPDCGTNSTDARLRQVRELLAGGLITAEEADRKTKEILSCL